MKWLKVAAILVAAVALAGCVSVTEVKSTNGHAYVKHGNMFGTNMLHCNSNNGDPQCWEVDEQEREGDDE